MKVECPSCGRDLNVKDEHSGPKAKCPACDANFTLPEARIPTAALAEQQQTVACGKCGTVLTPGQRFCPSCGAQAGTSSPPTNVEYPTLIARCFASVSTGYDVMVSSIPKKKLAKAKQLLSKSLSSDEEPLVLMDNTVFGSVKKGVLLTSSACHHHTDSGSGSFQYADIVSFGGKKGWPEYSINVVVQAGRVHTVAVPNGDSLAAFETFLSSLVKAPGIAVPTGQVVSSSATSQPSPAESTGQHAEDADEESSVDTASPACGVACLLFSIGLLCVSAWLFVARPPEWGIPGFLVWIPAALGLGGIKPAWKMMQGGEEKESENKAEGK